MFYLLKSETYVKGRAYKMNSHTDTCARKISYNLRKTLTLEGKTGKTGTFLIFLVQFDKVLSNLL